MSAILRTTVEAWCDVCGLGETFTWKTYPPTSEQIRRGIRRHGWVVDFRRQSARCPDHVGKRVPKIGAA